jgi:Uri superfamily endonuclease
VNSSIIGTYIVALRLSAAQTICIGRLGEVEFPAGWYLYVGSARGPGGLQARLARHKRRLGPDKRAHWHVDYLREKARWEGAWVRASSESLECEWVATLLGEPEVTVVAPGFGASDCRCRTHLVHGPALPEEGWFLQSLGAQRLDMEDRTLDEWRLALVEGDEERRETASLAAGRFGAEAVPLLAALLAGDDADARWWAARALAEVGTDDALPPLMDALLDVEPDVRACAALALGRIGHGEAASALAACLGDESVFVASVAADALSMMGEPAVDALVGMLADENPYARLLAVRALGRIKSERAMGPLFGLLEDSSYLVRHYARETLEASGAGLVFLAP